MRRFLAFIPRRYRLARWRVLLGAALTLAWWSYVGYHFVYDSIADAAVYLFVASWPLTAWLVYWPSAIAIRETASCLLRAVGIDAPD
jgi:hypothetical protein